MGKLSRDKGRRGERTAKLLLQDRDYEILADTTAGLSTDDLLVQKDGHIYSVEVKNNKLIDIPKFTAQARQNAKKRPWMLLCKIHQTTSWLVMGYGRHPVIWHEKGELTETVRRNIT